MKIGRVLAAAIALVLGAAAPAAAWTTAGAGGATAGAATMPTGPTPVATANGNDVTLTWSATSVGASTTDYLVTRSTAAGGSPVSAGGSCSGIVASAGCIDPDVPDGTWRYAITPVKAGWTGTESTLSDVVSVDTTNPVVSIVHPTDATTYSDAQWDAPCGGTICGTASDDGGVASVDVSIRRDATGLYWDGVAFTSATEVFTPATGTTSWDVAFPSSNFPTDGSYTVTAVATDTSAHSATAVATFTIHNDVTAPVMTTLEMLDHDANGKVDRVVATFDEALAPSTDTAPWTLSNVPSGGTLASVSTTGTQAILTLAEGAGSATTAVGSFTVALAASPTGIRDTSGNVASFAATTPLDAAAPARLSTEMFDVDTDGKVDRVVVGFSEALAAYGAGTTPWTLANVPSNGSLTSVAASGSTVTLTIAEGPSAANTAVGSFTVALASNASGVRDTAANLSAFSPIAPTDKASPVPVSITDTNGSTDGRIQAGDTMSITFSEALASAPASAAITITDPPGSGNDTITIGGVTNGARNLGRDDYVSANNTSYSFSSSTSAVSGGGTVLVVTVAGSCSGAGCGSIGTAAAAGTFAFAPATSLADPSGNAAAGALSTSIRLF